MSPTPKHLLHFEGGNALSAFRAQALLPLLQSVSPRITGVAARHVHWVWTDTVVQPDAAGKLASLLRYGDAYAGPTAADADTALVLVMPRLGTVSPWASKATDIAHNCGLALHRVERVTEFRLAIKTGLLGGIKTLADDELQAAAMLLHDRMTESVAFERDAALHLFDKQPAEPLVHVDLLAPGPRRAGGGQQPVRPRAVRRRDRLPGRRVQGPGAQPDGRRADDVRAGQQRALPPQDLQRAVPHRRPAAGSLDVRHDPQHREVEPAAQRRRVLRQRGRDGGPRDRALGRRADVRRQRPRALRRPRRDRARADEGGDAQPSDGDLAVPGRVHRLRRRDPRRGRHRPRLQAQGRPGRLLGGQPAPARHERGVGALAGGQARAHRQRAADHDRRAAGRRRVQQRVRPPEPGRLLPRVRAGRGRRHPRLSQAHHDRRRPRRDPQRSHAQDRVPRGHAADPARRSGHAHRHGRRCGQLDGRGHQHRGTRLRLRAARQPRDPASRAGGHQPVLATGRGQPHPRDPRRRRGRVVQRFPRAGRRRGRGGAVRSLARAAGGVRPRAQGDLVQREPGALRPRHRAGLAAAAAGLRRARALPAVGGRPRDRGQGAGAGRRSRWLARHRHAHGRPVRQAAEDAARRHARRARRTRARPVRRRRWTRPRSTCCATRPSPPSAS